MSQQMLHLFQPTPTVPLVGHLGFKFEAAAAAGGPWTDLGTSGVLTKEMTTADCQWLAQYGSHPGVNFQLGDCYEYVNDYPATTTHARATSCDVLVDGTMACSGPSNVIALPETSVGTMFFLFIFLILAIAYEGGPDDRS